MHIPRDHQVDIEEMGKLDRVAEFWLKMTHCPKRFNMYFKIISTHSTFLFHYHYYVCLFIYIRVQFSIASHQEYLFFSILYLVLLSCFIYLFVLISSPRGAANVCLRQYGIAIAHSYSFLYNINYIIAAVASFTSQKARRQHISLIRKSSLYFEKRVRKNIESRYKRGRKLRHKVKSNKNIGKQEI